MDRELINKQREIDESLQKDSNKRLSREEADILLPIFTTEQKKLLRIFLKSIAQPLLSILLRKPEYDIQLKILLHTLILIY